MLTKKNSCILKILPPPPPHPPTTFLMICSLLGVARIVIHSYSYSPMAVTSNLGQIVGVKTFSIKVHTAAIYQLLVFTKTIAIALQSMK